MPPMQWRGRVLSSRFALAAGDRLLILAPHPDDESIATGGLLQAARCAGAACRVVVLTDGDNNPWPQRWMEKRWRIDAVDRARWGGRRREEARAAMRILCLDESDARFLGLPDLGLTDLLMGADRQVIQSLRAQFDEFAPTLLVLPALGDRHPDHSATNILARMALAQYGGAAPRMLEFAVHGDLPAEAGIIVSLSDAQRDLKQAAILAHASQMRLGRRRFLRYAKTEEGYQSTSVRAAADSQHPLRAGIDGEGCLTVRIDLRRWRAALRGLALFLALESSERGSLRWLLRLDPHGGSAEVYDGVTGGVVTTAQWQRNADEMLATLLLTPPETLRQGYVKLARPRPGLRVFDRCGWLVLEFPERNPGCT